MHVVAPEPSSRRDIQVHGKTYTIAEYIGRPPMRGTYVAGAEAENPNDPRPQGFLVHQPAGAVTPPHFHEHAQFQVVVGGFARFGKHDAPPITVHYASGHTPYGPIAAGPDGVVYFTLRRAWDPGAKYMPASRDKLRPPPRRARVAGPFAAEDAKPGLEVLMEPEADGLAAWRITGEPGALLTPPAPQGDGQYHVVLDGSAGDMERNACAFYGPGEAAPDYRAGPDGASVLILQFPA